MGRERASEQVACLRRDLAQALGRADARLQRRDPRRRRIRRQYRRYHSQREGEGAGAAEQVGDLLRSLHRCNSPRGHRRLGLWHGLQEAAGWHGNGCGAENDARLALHHQGLARQAEACQTGLARGADGLHLAVGRQAAGLALYPRHINIQPVQRQSDMQGGSRFRMLQERRRHLRQGRKGCDQTGIGDRAFAHLDQPPRFASLEPQYDPTLRRTARMQCHPPSRAHRDGHRRLDLCFDRLSRQGQPYLFALPVQIGAYRPVLQRTAPTVAVLRGHGRDPVRAGFDDLDGFGPAVLDLGTDGLARQGQGREYRAGRGVGHAVPLPGHADDLQKLAHQRSLTPSRTQSET